MVKLMDLNDYEFLFNKYSFIKDSFIKSFAKLNS